MERPGNPDDEAPGIDGDGLEEASLPVGKLVTPAGDDAEPYGSNVLADNPDADRPLTAGVEGPGLMSEPDGRDNGCEAVPPSGREDDPLGS